MNEEPVVDMDEVLERVEGDRDLLAELFDIFLEDFRSKRAAFEGLLAAGSFPELKDAAHSLKGASGNISAKRVFAACLRLEQASGGGDADAVGEALGDLDRGVGELEDFIADFKRSSQEEETGGGTRPD